MSIVVNLDNNRLSIDIRELALAGFSLVQLTSFAARHYEVVRPFKDTSHHAFLFKDYDVRKFDLVEKDRFIRSIRSSLDELEHEGYVRNLFRK